MLDFEKSLSTKKSFGSISLGLVEAKERENQIKKKFQEKFSQLGELLLKKRLMQQRISSIKRIKY